MKPLTILSILLLTLSIAAAQGMPPAGVTTGAIRTDVIRDRIAGVASVEPWQRSVLSAEIAGLVTSYPLREGDPVVAKETVVCGLDDGTLRIDLDEAKALLARARAEADTAVETAHASMEEQKALSQQADREAARAKDLFADKVINRSELDRAEAEATAARHRYERAEQSYRLAKDGNDPAQQALVAEVRRAEASLARVEDRIAKTRIVAPLSGRVVRRLVEVGTWVTPGTPLIEVISLDPVLVRLGVNEKDIGKVAVGDPANVRVDAFPDRVFAGRVKHIVPEADPRSRNFPVLIEVPNAEGHLFSGMFARVDLESGGERKTLTVPKDAVVTSARGRMIVTFGEPNEQGLPTAKLVPVQVGVEVDGRVEVTGEGLAPGMPVVTTGNERIRPGQPLIPSGGGGPGGGGEPGGGK